MEEFFGEIIRIVLKAIIAFIVAGAYALIRMAIFGDDTSASAIEAVIVFVASILIGCGIVNMLTNKKK